jgi:hypothetical protein
MNFRNLIRQWGLPTLVAGSLGAVLIPAPWKHNQQLEEFLNQDPVELTGMVLDENYQKEPHLFIPDSTEYSFVLRDKTYGIIEVKVSDDGFYSKESYESAIKTGCYAHVLGRKTSEGNYLVFASNKFRTWCN